MDASFESKILRQMERLQNQSLSAIEAEVTQKRISWLEQNRSLWQGQTSCSPRRAFELLFFEYMGLSPQEVPVVQETGQQISWLSKNPCPTLEACLRLGMDTRQVCRLAYEKSTQAFLSHIDAQLRFERSYQEVRPYAPYCRESILRTDFDFTDISNPGRPELHRQPGW